MTGCEIESAGAQGRGRLVSGPIQLTEGVGGSARRLLPDRAVERGREMQGPPPGTRGRQSLLDSRHSRSHWQWLGWQSLGVPCMWLSAGLYM